MISMAVTAGTQYLMEEQAGFQRVDAFVRVFPDYPGAEEPIHWSYGLGVTVDMSVQDAAYSMLTIMRARHALLQNSKFCYVPASQPGEEGYLSEVYFDSSMEDPLLQSTSEMLENRDRDAHALRMELYVTRARLWTALTQLALVVQTGMVFTRMNRAPTHEQGEGSQAAQEELPHPPSLVEVMLEAERNKRETNHLLERIEQNTARQPRNDAVSLNDFVKLNPPKFHHFIDPLDSDDWLCSISCKIRSANVSEAEKVTFAAYFLEGPANLWWENFEAMRPTGPAATWADFSATFRLDHIPKGLMDRKRGIMCLHSRKVDCGCL
ncbi:hypothetical protein ZWY2020_039508 [Hordeum vulgare]|nr:hypothetical protein ZWY2020_039508 [Hordeum vulgare]